MIAPTTPTGSRTTSELPIFSSHAIWPTSDGCDPKVIAGSPAWMPIDWAMGMPSSAEMSAAISSARSCRRTATAAHSSARSSTGTCDQPSKAARAAATARSTSSAVPAGMRPMTSSVVALTTSIVSLDEDAVHSPPM